MTDWRRMLWGRDSFFPVLAIAAVSVIVSPVLDSFEWGFLAVFPLLAALVLLSLHRSDVSNLVMRIAIALLVIVAVGTVVTTYARHMELGDERILVAVASFLFAVLYLITIPSVTRRAFQHRHVTINTLAAGITTYLLIGLMFSAIYRGVSSIEHYQAFVGVTHPSAGDYSYFSFETITTLGYGDLAPRSHTMRTLAIFEAIVGQIFLVTAVARIVSLLGQQQEAIPMTGPAPDRDPRTDVAGSDATD